MRGSPSFTALSDAVDFITRALEVGDHGGLADACVTREVDAPGLATRREYRLRAIELLVGVHREKPLRALYAGQAFPPQESRFKLGGHARELGASACGLRSRRPRLAAREHLAVQVTGPRARTQPSALVGREASLRPLSKLPEAPEFVPVPIEGLVLRDDVRSRAPEPGAVADGTR